MLNLIALVILFFSLVGIGVLIYKKMPLLKTLPEKRDSKINWQNIFSNFKNSSFFKNLYFNFNVFLQKILSKIKILTLKVENKVSYWLRELKKHSQKNKKTPG